MADEPGKHCPECRGTGIVWPEDTGCDCAGGAGQAGSPHEPFCGSEPCPRGCAVNVSRTCPDGGTCYHLCGTRACFRVGCCGPLSGLFPWDEWPPEVLAEAGRIGGWS